MLQQQQLAHHPSITTHFIRQQKENINGNFKKACKKGEILLFSFFLSLSFCFLFSLFRFFSTPLDLLNYAKKIS